MLEINLDKYYEYELTLCRPDRTPIQTLTGLIDFEYTGNFPTTDEISFSLPKTIIHEGRKITHPAWESTKGDFLILLKKKNGTLYVEEKYFIITKPDLVSEDGKQVKHIVAFSQEYELGKKIIREYKFVSRQLYSQFDSKDQEGFSLGVLNYVLSLFPSWSVGEIDAGILAPTKYRSFDVSEQSALGFLINEVQKSFQCIFVFDTIEKKIHVKSIATIGQNRGFYISEENYMRSISQEIDHDEITTRLYVYGKDGVSINAVSPTGTSFVENFSYYKNNGYMSPALVSALNTYEQAIVNNTPLFQQHLANIKVQQTAALALYTQLVDLETELRVIQDSIDVAIKTGNAYGELNTTKNAKQTQVDNKKNEVNAKNAEINIINTQIQTLKNTLKKSNYFTLPLLKELDFFVREKTWSDSNYELATDLWEDLPTIFNKINQPPLRFDIDSIDFLSILECQHDWEKFRLGDIVNIECKALGFFIAVRLVKYSHSTEGHGLQLSFSNKESLDGMEFYLDDMIGNAILAGTTLDMSKYKWDLAEENTSVLQEFINNALDTSKNAVLAGKNQDIVINERGIALSDTTNPSKQIRIINNVIALTDDNWATAKVAIRPEGVVADRLIGKVILGNQLYIEDGAGELKIEGNLLTIMDKQGKVRTKLGEYATGKYGLQLFNKTGDQVVLDEDGIVQTDTIQLVDNVGANYADGLELKFYLDPSVKSVRQLKLAFSLSHYRTYSTSMESRGEQTATIDRYTTGGNSTDTPSRDDTGGSRLTTTGGGSINGMKLKTSKSEDYDYANESVRSYEKTDEGFGGWHNHGVTTSSVTLMLSPSGTTSFQGSGSHKHGSHKHDLDMSTHAHGFDHVHPPGNHTHVLNHSHTINGHIHPLVYGIKKESSYPYTASVYVDGRDAGVHSSNASFDLQHLLIGLSGWHTVTISCASLARVNASLFIKTFMGF